MLPGLVAYSTFWRKPGHLDMENTHREGLMLTYRQTNINDTNMLFCASNSISFYEHQIDWQILAIATSLYYVQIILNIVHNLKPLPHITYI